MTAEHGAPLSNSTEALMENTESVAEVSETDSHVCENHIVILSK